MAHEGQSNELCIAVQLSAASQAPKQRLRGVSIYGNTVADFYPQKHQPEAQASVFARVTGTHIGNLSDTKDADKRKIDNLARRPWFWVHQTSR
jgi:hypothetical protein